MKRPGTKSRLARGAAADLWRHTLSQIPSVFGRLVYLSAVREPNSGVYRHEGLALVFGEAESADTLRASHLETFGEWIGFSLEQQQADLHLYLSSLTDRKEVVIDTWLRSAPYRNLIPNAVQGPERKLFLSNLEALLHILRNVCGVADPDSEA